MRILLIEDHTQLAGLIKQELEENHGCSMTVARDPVEAREIYQEGRFDLAVIDLFYEHLNQKFDARRRKGREPAQEADLLVTGLQAARDLTTTPRKAKVVIWTAGDLGRRLHLLYAYEELGLRVYCSKSSGISAAETLMAAIRAAAQGGEYTDPVLNSYLPKRGQPTIEETLMRGHQKRVVWRAMARGACTRSDISAMTGYRQRTIGNHMSEMLQDLILLDPGIQPSRAPMTQLATYACRNWEFFLDAAICARWP